MNQDKKDTAEAYLSRVTQRLKDDGFALEENVTYENQTYDYVAKRTRFEIDKFGFAANSYLFARFPSINISLLRNYSKMAFKYALRAGGIIPIAGGIRLPRGLYVSVWCYPVAIVDDIDNETAEAIHSQAPPKHFMAFEMPVVYSLASRTLYYCEVTPTHGGLYYDQMRLIINVMLAP